MSVKMRLILTHMNRIECIEIEEAILLSLFFYKYDGTTESDSYDGF